MLAVGLRNADPAVARLREGGDGDVGRPLRQGPAHSGEIGIQLIEAQAAAGLEIQEETRRAVGRRGRAIDIRRQEIAVIRYREAQRRGSGRAAQHRVAVIGAELRAGEGLAVGEHVVGGEEGRVGRGRPYPEFRVIVQRAAEIVRIEIVAAARIVGHRHGDAFRIRRAAAAAQLRKKPAIGEAVVLDNRVAGVAAGASAAQAGPERAQRCRSTEQGAAFVEHGDLAVDHLDDVADARRVGLADGDIGVGRGITVRADAAELRLRLDSERRTLFPLEGLVVRARAARPGLARRQRFRRWHQFQILALCPMRCWKI